MARLIVEMRSIAARAQIHYLSDIDLLHPGVSSGFPVGLLFAPLVVWLLREALLRVGRAPRLFSRRGNAYEILLASLAWPPVVVYLFGPCWWQDTFVRLAHYAALNLDRQSALPPIEIFYWGRKYVYSLPWHNGFVLLAVTIPLGTLLLAAIGAWGSWSKPRLEDQTSRSANDSPRALVLSPRALVLYLLLHALTLPCLRMLGIPAHDGIRLMLPATFFLAALAGIGGHVLWRACARARPDRAVQLTSAAITLLMLPGALAIVREHPFELSYYNLLVGGTSGAFRRGLEVTYWYDAVNHQALARMNEALPEHAGLLYHQHVDVIPGWQNDGLLRADIRLGQQEPLEQAYFGLLTHSSKSNPDTRLVFAMRPHRVVARTPACRSTRCTRCVL